MKFKQRGWRFSVKSAFDCGFACCALAILSPLLLAVSLLVWVSMRRPILFRQQRPGRFAKPFLLLKFRTMLESCDRSGNLLPDAQRLTRVGLWLRATSIDQLPQLWTVFRGEISLGGAAAPSDGISATSFPRPGAPTRGHARHYRMGPD